MSTRSVAPSVWGAAGWRLIHAEAASAARAAAFPDLVAALKWLLPCPTCRDNYARHLAALPAPSGLAPSEWPLWAFRLHHKVNGTRPGVEGGPRRLTRAMGAPWTPAEISPFVEAVVETHPGGRAVGAEYVQALGVLTAVIGAGAGAGAPDEATLRSRAAMRRWFREWKKKCGCRDDEGAMAVGVCRFTPGAGAGAALTSACAGSH